MSASGGSSAFEEILAALERGEDLESIRASHPDASDSVERWIEAARRYSGSVRHLSGETVNPGLLSPGDRVGDFEVVSLLARGGEGEVYHARQQSLGGRRVALKVVPAEVRSSSARRRFEREAMLLADLHHPHLAEVYGFGEERGLLFLAMRLVEGPSLDRLSRAPVDSGGGERATRRLVGWAAQVAEALTEVHSKGLVHRDVKPSNIVVERLPEDRDDVTATGDAVLVDFGLARPVENSTITRTGWAVATPQYAPPEQLLGLEVDATGDVFALGATLHDLLTGRAPNERAQASAGLEPVRSLVLDLDADLAAVVDRACEAEPRWRYPEAGALAADLRRWLRGQPVSARRPSPARRAGRWLQEHPKLLVRSLGAALLVIVVSLALTGLGRWLAAADAVRAAWEDGDLVALEAASHRVPRGIGAVVLNDPEHRDAVDRLASGQANDPLVSAAAAMRADDIDRALRLSTTALQREGLDSEVALARLVLGMLGADRDPVRRMVALRYTARLFYETPVWTPAQRLSARPWRDSTIRLLSASSGEERLFVVSALAGCGDPTEVSLLLDLTEGSSSTELRRLAELACIRILRRGLNAGGLEDLDLPLVLERIGEDLSRILEAGNRSRYALLMAVILAHRERQSRVDLRPFLPSATKAALDSESPIASQVATLLALARDPQLRAWVRSGRYQAVHEATPRQMGFICTYLGDAEITSRTLEVVRSRAGEEGEREFERARAEAEEIVSGRVGKEVLDRETILSHDAGDVEPSCMEGLERSASEDAVLAAWDFTRSSLTREGVAVSARVSHGGLSSDQYGSYLLLNRFGESEVRLVYDVPEGEGAAWGEFSLDHLDARRNYYPYGGWVELGLVWDGQSISPARRIDGFENFGRSLWEVPERFLTPGRHEIVLRLAPRTNTTYRLVRAELRRSESLTPRSTVPRQPAIDERK